MVLARTLRTPQMTPERLRVLIDVTIEAGWYGIGEAIPASIAMLKIA
jgi:hypothetical protein